MKPFKKLKLVYTPDYDFKLIGIVSTAANYELCHWLNVMLKLDLSRSNDIEYVKKDSFTAANVLISFAIFEYHDEILKRDFHLLSNTAFSEAQSTTTTPQLFEKNEYNAVKYYLAEEAKEIHYFLKITGHLSKKESKELYVQLRKLSCITVFKIIHLATFKSKELFIIDNTHTK